MRETMRPLRPYEALKNIFGFTDANEVFKETKMTHPNPQVWERCVFCEEKFDLNNLHPGHVKYFGKHPHVCRRCGLCFGPYGKLWSDDLEKRIIKAKENAGHSRRCFMCKKDFNLLGSFYKHMWYKNRELPDLNLPDVNPE